MSITALPAYPCVTAGARLHKWNSMLLQWLLAAASFPAVPPFNLRPELLCGTPDPERSSHSAQPVRDFSNLKSLALTLFQVCTYMANTHSLLRTYTHACAHTHGRSGQPSGQDSDLIRDPGRENRWGSMMDWSSEPPGGDLRDPPPPPPASCWMLSH